MLLLLGELPTIDIHFANVLQYQSPEGALAYDLHIVRTAHWLDASTDPISKDEVNLLIAKDPSLAWSNQDFVDMKNDSGEAIRYWMIEWNGVSCFWWYREQIVYSGADDAQLSKLLSIAAALNAFVVGDDGEKYELRKTLLGKEKIVTV